MSYDYRGIKGATRLRASDLGMWYPDLHRWLRDLFHTEEYDKRLLILSQQEVAGKFGQATPALKTYTRLTLLLFTATHEYRISARPPQPDGQDTGYVGCTAKTRMARAGEDWTRGNDLHDGPYTQPDFQMILADIVRYEAVSLDIQETVRGIRVDGTGVVIDRATGTELPSGWPSDEGGQPLSLDAPVWLLERATTSGPGPEWLADGKNGVHVSTRDANLAIKFRSRELARAWKHVVAGGGLTDRRYDRDAFPGFEPTEHRWGDPSRTGEMNVANVERRTAGSY